MHVDVISKTMMATMYRTEQNKQTTVSWFMIQCLFLNIPSECVMVFECHSASFWGKLAVFFYYRGGRVSALILPIEPVRVDLTSSNHPSAEFRRIQLN